MKYRVKLEPKNEVNPDLWIVQRKYWLGWWTLENSDGYNSWPTYFKNEEAAEKYKQDLDAGMIHDPRGAKRQG